MTDILDRPIYTFAPMQDGQRFVAMIHGLPMPHRGRTALAARRAANDWRLIEAHKMLFKTGKFPTDKLAAYDAALARKVDKAK